MIVLDFFIKNQIILGMFIALCLFVPWHKPRKHFAVRGPACLAGAICLSAFAPIPSPPSLLVDFIVIAITAWICFRCEVRHALFAATCAYCVQHITSKMAYLILALWQMANYSFVLLNYIPLVLILLVICNFAVCLPVYYAGTRRFLSNRELKFDSLKTLVSTAAFIVAAVFLSYYAERSLRIGSDSYVLGYCCLNAFCMLFGLLVIIMNFMNSRGERLAEEKRTLEQLLQKDKQQYEIAKQNMERINIRYHDLKQQRGKALDEEELAKLDDEIRSFKTLYYTGNKAVDITLSEKAAVCADAGIQFVCSADGSCLDMIKPYHIYSLLGNAIDNAVECLSSVADEEKKVIRLDICRRGDMSVVRIGNYFPNKLQLENGMPVTTKTDKENHGFGIKSIKNVAEEYGGMMYIDIEDNVFTLVATMPSCETARRTV